MNNTFAQINLRNLQANLNSIRRKTKTKVMAVVKADAYGHGMLECVKALSKLKNRPEYYAVALLSEAIELRRAKIMKEPILCFSPFQKEDFFEYVKFNIIPTITTIQQLKQLLALKPQNKIKIHINVNTGMNRLGIHYENIASVKKLIDKNNNVIIDGIYTHFATSDEKDKEFAYLQLQRFKNTLAKLKELNICYGLAHCANSGAILDMPESYLDMVRPGISLYGYCPSQETSESIKLKPVMSLYSKLSTITELKKGDTVGYSRKFTAHKKIKSGTLPIGYADGILRRMSNKMRVIINDKIYSQIGRVSMDRISINLGNDSPKIGSKVILIGKSKSHQIDAWDWSNILETIPYEITCTISKRVPRKYVGIVK